MAIEELIDYVRNFLAEAGCSDVAGPFISDHESMVVFTFNNPEMIVPEFVTPGWVASGPNVDPTLKRGWKVDFTKFS
jgi:hypothetical protein